MEFHKKKPRGPGFFGATAGVSGGSFHPPRSFYSAKAAL
jgi:hypothetical protein